MSEKIVVFLFFLLPIFVNASTLKVIVKGPWSTRTTEVFRAKNNWICKTEVNPSVLTKQKPYSDELLASMVASTKKDCRDVVFIKDLTAKPSPKEYTGCADDVTIAPFLKQLDKNCRHSY